MAEMTTDAVRNSFMVTPFYFDRCGPSAVRFGDGPQVGKPRTPSSAHTVTGGGTRIPAQRRCVYSQLSMDWDNLKFFLTLAETGSLSRASEKLRVDHSTVARRID